VTELPFKGLRVIDFTLVWAGPFATRILADFGAEVIKLESIQRPDRVRYMFPPKGASERLYNRGGYFHEFNRNKYGLTLDLTRHEGKEVFKQLLKISDLFLANYPPRVLANLGLEYPVIKRVKPDIIMLAMPGYGMTGPYSNFPGYGSCFEAFSGLTSLRGIGSNQTTVLADPAASLHAVFAVLAALKYRRQTGRGQFIDLSQTETTGCLMEEAFLEYTINGHEPYPIGNRHRSIAPHGVYRCRGEDEWIAITVASDEQWRGFCSVLGNLPWISEEKFSTSLSRWKNQDELDKLIEQWTLEHDAYDVMHLLQSGGVAAGIAFNSKEILSNPHLQKRDYFWQVTTPGTGTYPFVGPVIKLSKISAKLRMPPPALGEHNEYVLGHLLGLSADEIADLEEKKIIGKEPPGEIR